ncbi:MAG TPA: metalloregulator ArsR/SmtB family transcription factor [Patescibacteria group bacterium]|nr:metalloregulator ArsR/SmtB family transcription factor [Patescibacteria group bacterium]
MTVNERVLKALANRRRLTIVTILKRRRSATVGELAAALKVTLPTTSKHLAMLSTAEVVEYERQSLNVFYHLADDMPVIARAVIKHL